MGYPSIDPTVVCTYDESGLRFDLEENFLDDESADFQLESCKIWPIHLLVSA